MPQSLFSFDEIPNLLIFDKIDSTSKEIFRMINNGFAANGDIVIADIQTEGHGRNGRVWESQKVIYSHHFYCKQICQLIK